MIKTMYMLWFQGFASAPELVLRCVDSWQFYNPDWNIVLLDSANLTRYVDLENYVANVYGKPIEKCHLSDIVRSVLLSLYGGLWVDATTFCNKPLNDWLPHHIKEGFFAFDRPCQDRLLSNWFLYSEKNNYVMRKWCDSTLLYYNTHFEAHTYAIHHYLFGDLYSSDGSDGIFRQMWDKVPKLSADGPHYLQEKGMFAATSAQTKLDIDSKITPLYKLTHKCGCLEEYDIGINLHYLYSTVRRPANSIKTPP